MKTKTKSTAKLLFALTTAWMVSILAPVSVHATTINSNGTGGGNWATSTTWSGGVVPPNNGLWSVQAPDTVTAGYGVTYSSTSLGSTVLGTLNINSGASISTTRLNYNQTTGSGTINVNGGTLTSNTLLGSAGYRAAINISNGGLVNQTALTSASNDYTITINNGGTFINNGAFSTGGAIVNLNAGGTISETNAATYTPFGNATFNWNGGTVILNTNSYAIANSVASGLNNAFKNSSANILQLSNMPTKQTLTLGGTTTSGVFNSTVGTMAFNVYSSTANDNDLFKEANATPSNATITLGSGVHVTINNAIPTGLSSSYVGASYQLFSTAASYGTITPTLDPTVWTFNGMDYTVNWTNTLSTNGAVTVASLAPVVSYGPGDHYTFPEDANGWSIIPINPDPAKHQTIYVSSSTGSDSNNGLTTASPKKTIVAGMALVRQGSSDWVLLKRGDTFPITDNFGRTGQTNFFGTAIDPLYPQVCGAYGTGARPIVTFYFKDWFAAIHNYVIQDLQFIGTQAAPSTVSLLGNTNTALFEDCFFSTEVVVQGNPTADHYMSQITFRRCSFLDAHYDTPTNGTTWGYVGDPNEYSDILNNRISGMFVTATNGFLFEENVMDHNGWTDGYDPNGDQAGLVSGTPQPPSEFSHNLYVGGGNYDLTIRNNISTRGASMGFKLLSRGVVAGNVMVGNNIGMIVDSEGSYLMARDNVDMSTADKNSASPYAGARGWGIDIDSAASALNGVIIRNIDADSTAVGANTSMSTPPLSTYIAGALLSAKNVVYHFGTATDWNQAGTTYTDPTRNIATYNQSVGGLGTLDDFYTQVRAQSKDSWNPAYKAQNIVHYIQLGFNQASATRTAPATVTFSGTAADGIRWDDPDNWSTLDYPGTVSTDVADIVAKEVVYSGTTSLARLQLENGAILDIDQGGLTLPGTESIRTVGTLGGTINLGRSGMLTLANYTTSNSPLTINQSGGNLVVTNNLGSGTSVKLAVNIEGGTAILGSTGSGSTFASGNSLNIYGSAATVGYTTGAGTQSITFGSGSILSFTLDSTATAVSPIAETYGSTVSSALTINSGATLNIDLSGKTGLTTGSYSTVLAKVDSLTGSFGAVNFIGAAASGITNPQIVYNYTSGAATITLTYSHP